MKSNINEVKLSRIRAIRTMNKEIYKNNGYAMLPYIYAVFLVLQIIKKNQQDLHIFALVKSQEHRVKVEE